MSAISYELTHVARDPLVPMCLGVQLTDRTSFLADQRSIYAMLMTVSFRAPTVQPLYPSIINNHPDTWNFYIKSYYRT